MRLEKEFYSIIGRLDEISAEIHTTRVDRITNELLLTWTAQLQAAKDHIALFQELFSKKNLQTQYALRELRIDHEHQVDRSGFITLINEQAEMLEVNAGELYRYIKAKSKGKAKPNTFKIDTKDEITLIEKYNNLLQLQKSYSARQSEKFETATQNTAKKYGITDAVLKQSIIDSMRENKHEEQHIRRLSSAYEKIHLLKSIEEQKFHLQQKSRDTTLLSDGINTLLKDKMTKTSQIVDAVVMLHPTFNNLKSIQAKFKNYVGSYEANKNATLYVNIAKKIDKLIDTLLKSINGPSKSSHQKLRAIADFSDTLDKFSLSGKTSRLFLRESVRNLTESSKVSPEKTELEKLTRACKEGLNDEAIRPLLSELDNTDKSPAPATHRRAAK